MKYLTHKTLLAIILSATCVFAQDNESHRRLKQNPYGKSDLQMRLELLQRLQRIAKRGNLDINKLSKEAREKLKEVQQKDKQLRQRLEQQSEQNQSPDPNNTRPSPSERQLQPPGLREPNLREPNQSRRNNDAPPTNRQRHDDTQQPPPENRRGVPDEERNDRSSNRDAQPSPRQPSNSNPLDPDEIRRRVAEYQKQAEEIRRRQQDQPGTSPPDIRPERSERPDRTPSDPSSSNRVPETQRREPSLRGQPSGRSSRQPSSRQSSDRDTPGDRDLGPTDGLDLERYMKQMEEFQRSNRSSANRSSSDDSNPNQRGSRSRNSNRSNNDSRSNNPTPDRSESWRDILKQVEKKSRTKPNRPTTPSPGNRSEPSKPDTPSDEPSSDDSSKPSDSPAPSAPGQSSDTGSDSSSSSPGTGLLRDTFRRTLSNSIDDIMKGMRNRPRNQSRPPRPPRAPGMLRDVGRRTGEFFSNNKPSFSPPSAGGGMSMPSAPSATAFLPFLIGIALLAIGWFAMKWLGGTEELAPAFANAVPANMPKQINGRQDVIDAFHFIAAESPAVQGNWWTHSRVGRALRKLMPAKNDDVGNLTRVYETARYLPPNEELTPQQLQTAREAIERCKP